MTINVKDCEINYIQYGKGKDIVLLHGWGQNIEMMAFLGDRFKKDYRITILDLPGFGLSTEPKDAFTIHDYSDVLEILLKELKIENPIIIGHSFGGRVAICYASNHRVDKLILFGSPCVRENKKESLKVKILKSLKKVPGLNKLENVAKKHIGSRDYKNASEIMRKILVNTVNEDLSDAASNIICPTLLIWGAKDIEAPLKDAEKLEKLIPDCGLIVYENGTHYAYLEYIDQVVNVIKTFL